MTRMSALGLALRVAPWALAAAAGIALGVVIALIAAAVIAIHQLVTWGGAPL